MKNIFCVISAIGNDYGIFNYEQRLNQLKNTIDSINNYAPNSDIVLVEASEILLPKKDLEYFSLKVKKILLLHDDIYIKFLKDNSKDPSPNKYEKKTIGEIQSILAFLIFLKNQPTIYKRVFKLGGRLSLNSNFDLTLFNNDFLVLLNKEQWYDEKIFPMRLWSFSFSELDNFLLLFQEIQSHIINQVTNTGQLELVEFVFTKFVDKFQIPFKTVDKIGVEGLAGLSGGIIDE